MNKNQLRLLWRSLACGLFLFTACCLVTPVSAQDGWDEEEEAVTDDPTLIEEVPWESSTRKKEMEDKMNAQIAKKRKELQIAITPQSTVNYIESLVRRRVKDPQLGDFSLLRIPGINLNWRNYNRVPPKKLSDIVDLVVIAAEENAEDRIRPEEQKAAIREQAEERFKMVKPGERVSILLRGGRGANAIVDNEYFRSANDEYVQLGNRLIIKEDLDPEDQAKFYPDINAKLKEAYVVNNCGKVDVEYDSLVDAYIYNNTAEEFRKNFYVPDITKPTASLRTAKPDFWVPMKDFVEKVCNTLIERALDLYKATELHAWMLEQGYYLVDKKDGKPGETEWVDIIEKNLREMPAPAPTGPQGGMGPNGMPYPGGPGPYPGQY